MYGWGKGKRFCWRMQKIDFCWVQLEVRVYKSDPLTINKALVSYRLVLQFNPLPVSTLVRGSGHRLAWFSLHKTSSRGEFSHIICC